MKLKDLNEGMEFHPSVVSTDEKGQTWVTPAGMRQEETECWVCDGTGKETYGEESYPCGYCKGTGKASETVYDGPQLQVSNANGHAIITDMLGLPFDYAGSLENKDLPALRQKLIKMINSEKQRSSMHKPLHDNNKERTMAILRSKGNVTDIGKQGARVVDMGRSDTQVLRYANTMLQIIDYAMKNNLVVSWG